MTARASPRTAANHDALSIGLSAVIVAVTGDEPKVLAVRSGDGQPDALPFGPLEPRHRTLEAGLRSWVEHRTHQSLGYVEQLYTFSARNRFAGQPGVRALSVGYLALVHDAWPEPASGAFWCDWYRYLPWEDWRAGKPAVLARIERALKRWVAAAPTNAERRLRDERASVAFGLNEVAWSDERVLERYELLYYVGLVLEAHRDRAHTWASRADAITEGQSMLADHRRVLATGIARVRGKIKYRPVVFELMPEAFTFLQLQRTVEALAGLRLHKSNFRRLVESQGLVEDTGKIALGTGGRPARLLRFRPDVLLERPAPGVRLPKAGVRS